ncbi:MAG: hypothetical protein ACLPVO_00405 [Desulfomonilaceae bacterium]
MEKFEIGYWCGPPKSHVSSESFNNIVKCGFTFASIACDVSYDATYIKPFIAAANEAKIPAMIADGRILNAACNNDCTEAAVAAAQEWKQAQGVFGYLLGDEPNLDPNIFKKYADIVTALRANDPARKTWINLLPLGIGSFTDENEWRNYIKDCITVIKPDYLSFDYYPHDVPAERDLFSKNLRIFRDVCRNYQKPFWVAIDAFPPRNIPDAYPPGCLVEFMRWQAIEAVRYWASGIFYFTYWTPVWGSDNDHSIVKPDGTLTSRYDEVKQLNDDLRAVTAGTAEVHFVRVRSKDNPEGAGDLWLVDSNHQMPDPNTARRLAEEGWNWKDLPIPGYGYVNELFSVDGFLLSARNDLLDRAFWVLNVVNGAGSFYRVTRGETKFMGSGGWADQRGTRFLGRSFDNYGFQIFIE